MNVKNITWKRFVKVIAVTPAQEPAKMEDYLKIEKIGEGKVSQHSPHCY